MLSSPGTVSRILWHFTAGPRWNKRTDRQNKKPRPATDAYKALTGILESKELRVGQKEWVNLQGVAITVLDRGREGFVDPAYRNARFQGSPACCLADIQIIHLGYHANRYGKFAIGFHRNKIIEAGFSPVFYQVEHWVLDQISGGRFDASWAAFTADFQRLRLPCLIGLLASLLALRSFVAIQGRWRRLTRRINIGLNMALACLILAFAVDGNIFQSSLVDQIARNVLALVALIYLPSVGVQLYGEIGRLDRTGAMKEA